MIINLWTVWLSTAITGVACQNWFGILPSPDLLHEALNLSSEKLLYYFISADLNFCNSWISVTLKKSISIFAIKKFMIYKNVLLVLTSLFFFYSANSKKFPVRIKDKKLKLLDWSRTFFSLLYWQMWGNDVQYKIKKLLFFTRRFIRKKYFSVQG